MGVSETGSKKTLSAGVLIRHEIVRMVLTHSGKSVKLPSARQLAIKFGFSQRTVAAEFAALVAEGWIFGKKGIGYFSNPEKDSWGRYLDRRIAGIAWGDTKLLCCDYNVWTLQSHAGMALPPQIAYPRMLSLHALDAASVEAELRLSELDGIVWGGVPVSYHPILQKLRREGIPVVTLLSKIEGIPNVGISSFASGRKIAGLLDWSRPGVVLWYDGKEQFSYELGQGICADAPAGRFFYVEHYKDFPVELERLLAAGTPPLAYYGCYNETQACFAAHNLNIRNDSVQIVDWGFIRNDPDFRGIYHRYPYEKMGKAAADLLRCQFEHQPVDDSVWEWEIVRK